MKEVMITGVSGGLGKALAFQYLKEGCRVYGYGSRSGRCEDLKEQYPEKFVFQKMDIRDTDSVNFAAGQLSEKYTDKIDILINCAAILPANSENTLEYFNVDEAMDVLNVNSLGPLRVVKAFLPFIKKGNDKWIINISSEAGSITTHADYINRYDYCMSKAALNIQSVILQRYVQPFGIKVLLIHPGWMKTEMGGEAAPLLPEESASEIRKTIKQIEKEYHKIQFLDYNGSIRPW